MPHQPLVLSLRHVKRDHLAQLRARNARIKHQRPTTRAQCESAARPCPYISCRYHLASEVKPSGSLMLFNAHLPLDRHPATCALDVADLGGKSLDEVGALLCLTKERVRQIEASALRKVAMAVERIEQEQSV